MKREHDHAANAAWRFLLRRGYRVAWEVGVRGGRVDIVRLDTDNRWLELYEVKLRAAETGIPQLLRYAGEVEGDPKLTLVVPPDLVTPALEATAEASGVTVWSFNWKRHRKTKGNGRGEYVVLPSLSEEAIERISTANRAWGKTPAAKLAQRNAQESKRYFKERMAA